MIETGPAGRIRLRTDARGRDHLSKPLSGVRSQTARPRSRETVGRDLVRVGGGRIRRPEILPGAAPGSPEPPGVRHGGGSRAIGIGALIDAFSGREPLP